MCNTSQAIKKIKKMKKLLFITVLFWSGIIYSQNSPKKIAIDDNGLGKQFPDCHLSGSICKLFPTGDDPETSLANAFKTSEKSFSIEIRKNSMSEEKQIALLGKTIKNINGNEKFFLQINTPFLVDSSFLSLLNIPSSNNTIAVGNYPIKVGAEYLVIHLALSAN